MNLPPILQEQNLNRTAELAALMLDNFYMRQARKHENQPLPRLAAFGEGYCEVCGVRVQGMRCRLHADFHPQHNKT